MLLYNRPTACGDNGKIIIGMNKVHNIHLAFILVLLLPPNKERGDQMSNLLPAKMFFCYSYVADSSDYSLFVIPRFDLQKVK